jgi:hypothetical protein
MSKFLRMLGFAWASPLTAAGLLYATLFTLFGWYKRIGSRGDALLWQLVPEKAPARLLTAWKRWGGHTIGNVVVMKYDPDSDRGRITLRHEQEHVHQCMTLGILQPIAYYVAYFALKTCRYSHPYYDNPFEIDARRAAGQVIDVVGVVKRAAEQGKLTLKPTK